MPIISKPAKINKDRQKEEKAAQILVCIFKKKHRSHKYQTIIITKTILMFKELKLTVTQKNVVN